MSFLKKVPSLSILVLLSTLFACSFGPPESCGESVGGTADSAKFAQHFSKMAFVNQEGQAGPERENGMEYTTSDQLELRADSLEEVEVRLCIQRRDGGSIAFDQSQTFTAGSSGMRVGSFEPGNYVVRVIVDDTLVQNYPFFIK